MADERSDDRLGRLDDSEESSETSSTREGAAAEGEYDAAQGSPPDAEHPTGEDYPDEAVRYDESGRPRSEPGTED